MTVDKFAAKARKLYLWSIKSRTLHRGILFVFC